MHCQIVGGTIRFPLYLFKFPINQDKHEEVVRFNKFNLHKDGLLCFSEEEKIEIISMLEILEVKYTIENIDNDDVLKNKHENVKYKNEQEAMRHLLHGEEPDRMKHDKSIDVLLKRLEKAEKDLAITKKDLADTKGKLKI